MKKIKLSYRLKQLQQMISNDYQHIWDCCCDHGYLGMALLQNQLDSNEDKPNPENNTIIHFVDIVKPLMELLQKQLEAYYNGFSDEQVEEPPSKQTQTHSQWSVSCQDVGKISLAKKQSNLIIIAGVGGEKTIKLIQQIIENNAQADFEFLLCPVHQNYLLREFLIQQNFALVQEQLIKENHRFYELLHVSKTAGLKLSLVGSEQWDYSRKDDQLYLNKMIHHFQQKALDPFKNVGRILTAYQQLRCELEQSV